ncbi:tetratricopeptide repeat protein [Nocardia macrotermitis]|uniref:Uncharacterized protein n=1 Tax=Nocardia macrotermitis TaxID=2585198 RepID=A0A7K0CXY0_9NOCA|nr:tetratricopeptide repeat protein [Nocardia macrotermitis]MQY18355.1 hypothetical protein [Nocardia macrotermitis]
MTRSAGGGPNEIGSARALFARKLVELFHAAADPTLDRVVRKTRKDRPNLPKPPTVQRLSDWRSGKNLPAQFELFEPPMQTLITLAKGTGNPAPAGLLDRSEWHRIWKTAFAEGSSPQPVISSPTVPGELSRELILDTLPSDKTTLIGRDAALDDILTAAGTARSASIHTIDGMPGIGKTALAVRVAHRLAEQFPDGRYFVSLHAHTPGHPAATPTDVLADLLTCRGVDPRNIPDTLESRRNLWRDRLSGKRILLVLDDARDAAQVEPLLPNGSGCLTLITSRRRLVALDDSLPHALSTLHPDDAADLLRTLTGRRGESDLPAVRETVQLCGYLPLAIVLVAARLVHHPSWTVAQLAADLATTRDRLGEFAAGERAVYAAFTMSYADLPPTRQRLFRRLSLHPGPEIDTTAAAVLDGIPAAKARAELDALFTDHLLDEPARGRYRMHDLLHEYALALTAYDPADDRRTVVNRLLDHYQDAGILASRYLAGEANPPSPFDDADYTPTPRISSFANALDWLRTERANLLACLEYAATQRHSDRVVRLTAMLAGLLRLDGPWPLAITLHRRAATIAEHSGDIAGAATALMDLSVVRWAAGDYPGTADLVRQALQLYRDTGDRRGQAQALGSLARLGYATGDYEETAVFTADALVLYRDLGDHAGHAYALIGTGMVRHATGDYPGAATLIRDALTIFQNIGDRPGEAYALNEIGMIRYATGDYPGASKIMRDALAIYRDTGDRTRQADVLNDLVAVRFATGDYPGAGDLANQSLGIYRELGDRLGQANTIECLGRLCYATGDSAGAAEHLNQALEIFAEIGDRVGQAYTLNELSMIRYARSDFRGAAAQLSLALTFFTEIGDRVGRAYTLMGSGLVRYASGDLPSARVLLHRASDIFTGIGDRVGQAYALCSLGRLNYADEDMPTAVEQLRQALDTFRETGDQVGEAYALSCLSRLRYASEDYSGSDDLVRQAMRIYDDIGDRFGHAFALSGQSVLLATTEDFPAATERLQQALTIFGDIGDRVSHAYAFVGLGVLRYMAGDYEGATELVEQAPLMFREIGDKLGEAYAFMGLALFRYRQGDYSGAADLVQRLMSIFSSIGEHPEFDVLQRIDELWAESSTGPQNGVIAYIDALRLVREIQVRWKKRRIWRDLPVPAWHRQDDPA